MFGYITVDKETITPKDYRLFNAFYCGLCLTFKKRYGNKTRIFNNFDSAFAFVLLASYLGYPVLITGKKCIIHPFKKTPMLELENFTLETITQHQQQKLQDLSNLANSIADITILLVKGKMYDNILDKEKGAKSKMKFFKKALDFASSQLPEFEHIVMQNTNKTAELEKNNGTIEELASLSGEILGNIPVCVLGINKNTHLYNLFVEIGKWVYYVDAIYDLEQDYKKKSFNPFIAKFGNYTTRQNFVSTHKFEIMSYLNSCLNNIQTIYKELCPSTPNTLVENILFSAMEKQQTIILTNPNKKLTI